MVDAYGRIVCAAAVTDSERHLSNTSTVSPLLHGWFGFERGLYHEEMLDYLLLELCEDAHALDRFALKCTCSQEQLTSHRFTVHCIGDYRLFDDVLFRVAVYSDVRNDMRKSLCIVASHLKTISNELSTSSLGRRHRW